MPSPQPAFPESIVDRITQLEIKTSFQEDLLDKLDRIVTRQQDQIDLLMQELRWLRQHAPEAGPAELRNPGDERPPHY